MIRAAVTICLVPEARGGPFVFWDDIRNGCETAANLGFDAVELFVPSADAVDPELLRRILDDCGLCLAAVGTGAGWLLKKLSLSHIDRQQRAQACDFVRSMIDFAGPFEAPRPRAIGRQRPPFAPGQFAVPTGHQFPSRIQH